MARRFVSVIVGFLCLFLGLWVAAGGAMPGYETTLVSRHSDGTLSNNFSTDPSITADGSYVVFSSLATNLTDVPPALAGNVIGHNRLTGQTVLISRAMDGSAAGDSESPAVAAGGGFVVYESTSDALVADDDNAEQDIFVYERATGQTTLVSRHSDGTIANSWSLLPSISGDGRYVVFASNADNLVDGDSGWNQQVYLHDRQTGETMLISRNAAGDPGNGRSTYPDISADGNTIVFESEASNLNSPDDNGMSSDIYVYDRPSGRLTRASRHSDGTQGDGPSVIPSVSGDGRRVAFQSFAANLVADDINDTPDIFVHDRLTGETWLVSRHTDGTPADGPSNGAAIADNGRTVAFNSVATTLVDDATGQQNAFRHDLQTGATIMVSRHSDGTPGNATTYPLGPRPVAVANSGAVAFESEATNLVDDDTNQQNDIFVNAPPPPTLSYRAFVPITQ